MFLNCYLAKALLQRLAFKGMDWSKVEKATFAIECTSKVVYKFLMTFLLFFC